MPVFNVFLKSDTDRTVPAYSYEAAASVPWNEFPFDTFDHVEAPSVAPDTPAVIPGEWIITKRNFWNRFPANNETAMRAIMLAGTPVLLAAGLERLKARVESSPYVDLLLPETQQGVQWLASTLVPETVTLEGVTLPFRLTPSQMNSILNVKPTAAEVYRG